MNDIYSKTLVWAGTALIILGIFGAFSFTEQSDKLTFVEDLAGSMSDNYIPDYSQAELMATLATVSIVVAVLGALMLVAFVAVNAMRQPAEQQKALRGDDQTA